MKRFERDNVPPERAATQQVRVRVRGGRTGKRALLVEDLAMPGVFDAFSTEIMFGERVGVLGANGTGKSHFLRLVAGEELAHTGRLLIGARVQPGLFSQLHDRAELHGRPVLDVLMSRGLDRGAAMAAVSRYELRTAAEDPFDRLSGGQQARVQILLLEIDNPTMLLLDEPTDNLDLDSAEALEAGLDQYEGTVVAVTHDRWFMRVFDRFLIFERDGRVRESLEPLEAWHGPS